MNAFRDWWLARVPRERWLLGSAAAVAVLLIAYLAVIEPLQQRRALLERGVAAQRETLAWMHRVVVPARGTLRPRSQGDDASLFAAVDRSARSTALAGALQRVQPEGTDTVRVWLEDASFDELVRWLASLERDQGITVSALAVQRAEGAGLVGARVTLERSP